ncbi:MAG: IS66 family transposase [Candidatus Saccharimonadales bacterium]
MQTSTAKNHYEHLDRTGLLAVVMERDATIKTQREELVKVQEQFKEVSRILNLRNKKIFGSTSEKQDPTGVVEDLEFEEVKSRDQVVENGKEDAINVPDDKLCGEGESGAAVIKKNKNRSYKNGHPGRKPIGAHIRREVTHFYPEGYDATWNREMPPEITERLTLKIDFYVKVDVRHKFARGSGIVVAPCALQDPFYKYKATTELVCHMMYLRFGLQMPYYRFGQLLAGAGLSYSTLIGWAARGFDILAPLGPLLAEEILKDTKLVSMDETPFKLLDAPGKIKAFKADLRARHDVYLKEVEQGDKQPSPATSEDEGDMEEELAAAGVAKGKVVLKGYMWTLLNATVGLVSFQYSPSRATINALLMLSGYKGMLMADAYTAYRRLAKESRDAIILLSCWAHARRRILESQDPKFRDPVVTEIIRRIGKLYEIEGEIKGLSPRKKKRVRKRSKKLLRALKKYLEKVINKYAPKEAVRIAIQYMLNHWDALSAYVQHQHGIIDNNAVERTIRPITLARKNSLFLGSVDHAAGAALLYSLMECCKLQKIDPQVWLLDVMRRIEYCPREQLIDLLPHRWKKIHQRAQIPS